MLCRKRCSARKAARLAAVMSSPVNIASTPSPISLSTVAAGLVNGVDGGLGVIVEKRDDLVGGDGFADRSRATQIGKPQHRFDTLGYSPRYPPMHNLFCRVTPEIDPAEGSGDIDLCGGLDRQPQHRHEIAQRRQVTLTKTFGPPRHPVGIEAVHLADGSGLAEPVHIGHEVPVTLGCEVVRSFEKSSEDAIRQDRSSHFVMTAVFEHVK